MCTLSTQPSSAGLGQTLASQMTAAHQFVTATPATAFFAAHVQNASCLASTYQFAGPPSYAPDASSAAAQHAGYARTFADSIRPHFDRKVGEDILAAKEPLDAYRENGLPDIGIPDMVAAGLLSVGVAMDLSREISIKTIETFRKRASWDNQYAFLPRVFSGLFAAGLLVTIFNIPPGSATLLLFVAFLAFESAGKWLFDNAKWGENAKLTAIGRRAINDQAMLAGPKQREQPLITTTDQAAR